MQSYVKHGLIITIPLCTSCANDVCVVLGDVGDEECGEGMEQEDEEEMEDGEPDHVEAPLPEEDLNNQVCFCMTGGYGE